MTSHQGNPLLADRFVALVGLINRESALLEHLVFKLRSAELLANAGESRFLTFITDEVDTAGSDLGAIEVARALLVADITQVLHLADDATLLELAARAPAEVAGALYHARDRLIGLMNDLDAAAAVATGAVNERLNEVTTALERVHPARPQFVGHGAYAGNGVAPYAPSRFDHDL
jgi:hypothetical protein